MTEFRVVTNGKWWKVQRKGRFAWRDCCSCGAVHPSVGVGLYDTDAEARRKAIVFLDEATKWDGPWE